MKKLILTLVAVLTAGFIGAATVYDSEAMDPWFASTADALGVGGIWTGAAAAQDGRIALVDAEYFPYSKTKARLRVIEFTGVFGVVPGTDSLAPDNAKFGIEIRETVGDYCFHVIANGNWLPVASVEADPTAEYHVSILLDGDAKTVTYSVSNGDGPAAVCGPYANEASADGISRIRFEGMTLLDSLIGVRSGLPANYAFNAARKRKTVTINVDPAAVTESGMALAICYDAKDRGADAASWGHFLVVDNAVAPTGGTYTVDLSAAGITSGFIRPFLATCDGTTIGATLNHDPDAMPINSGLAIVVER